MDDSSRVRAAAHDASRALRLRGSIVPRVLVSVTAVITAVIVLQSIATWREVRRSAEAVATLNAHDVIDQVNALVVASRQQMRGVAQIEATSEPLLHALRQSSDTTIDSTASRALRSLIASSPQMVAAEIVSSQGAIRATAGDPGLWRASARALLSQRNGEPIDSVQFGALRSSHDGVLYPVLVPMALTAARAATLIVWCALDATAAEQLHTDNYTLYIGNRHDSTWTRLDLTHPQADRSGVITAVVAPPDSLTSIVLRRPLDGTPWDLAVSMPRGLAMSSANGTLTRVLLESLAILLVALAVASMLTGRVVRPLESLMHSVERVAGGNYDPPTDVLQRDDEFGHLSQAFRDMVVRVDTAFAAQRESEAHYRELFNAVPMPLWVFHVDTWKVLAVNDAAIEHYGYSREEFLSLTIDQLRPPDEVPRLREVLSNARPALASGGRWRHCTKDGRIIFVDVITHAITYQDQPARIIVARDVTEQLRATDSARRMLDRYSRFIRESNSAITISTIDGRFLSANPAFLNLVGIDSEAELLTQPPARFWADANRSETFAKLRRGASVRDEELHVKRMDGATRTVLFSARIVKSADGDDEYIESVAEDITERRAVEQQLLHAQKMETVGQLAGSLAHDFNNLLTVILANQELALESIDESSPARESLDDIASAARSAATLARQLLVFSRQSMLSPALYVIDTLVTDAHRMIRRAVTEDVRLDVQLDPDAGTIRIDKAQFEQIVVNLAINANDAMPKGGTLSISTAAGASIRRADGSHVPATTLIVRDSGTGMDAWTLARCFEPFFTTKARGRGTGLGLASVYAIVQKAGGQITAESEPGSGTTFRIVFPTVNAIAPAISARPADDTKGTGTVMVVEDQSSVRSMIMHALVQRGYSALGASNGAEALALASLQHEPIHLLITDVVMPEVGGRELADAFVAIHPESRVLFISGYTDDTLLARRVQTDQASFLAKPFSGDEIARKVRDMLTTSMAA